MRVASVHLVSAAVEGDGPGFAFAEGNLAFRAGITSLERLCLMLAADGIAGLALSTNDTSLLRTVSRAGT